MQPQPRTSQTALSRGRVLLCSCAASARLSQVDAAAVDEGGDVRRTEGRRVDHGISAFGRRVLHGGEQRAGRKVDAIASVDGMRRIAGRVVQQ